MTDLGLDYVGTYASSDQPTLAQCHRRVRPGTAKEVNFLQSRELTQRGTNFGCHGRQASFELIEPTLTGFAIQIEGFIEIGTVDLTPEVLELSAAQGCDSRA
jgi:hypothetical protein